MNRMKNLMVSALMAMAALVFSSCDSNEVPNPEEQQIEVNANNISGKWELAEWNNSGLAAGTYVYLDIVRNDKTYTMYQNIDSFSDVPHVVTGSYYIDYDVELGAIIRGNYDHDSGEWAHRYRIVSLTQVEMVWVAKDDETFIQTFRRIDSIPVVKEN